MEINRSSYAYTFKNGDSRTICCQLNDIIVNHQFEGSNVKTVEITSGITSIGKCAFNGCSSLVSVTIPDSVTSIGNYAFNGCSSLSSITVNSSTPPTLGGKLSYGTINFTIYVPSTSVDIYKSASGWSEYADRIQAIP